MKIFTLLHKSTDKGTVNLGQWSRMGTVNVRTTSDSILSRICLASLILLMLGGFTTRAWGDNTATITRRSLGDTDWSGIVNGNSSSAYITWKGNDSGTHVTFKLSGGTFKNSTWDYFQSTGDQTHAISWTVDPGYTISVKEVSLVVRSSLNGSTVKVGQAGYATNPYGGSDDFVTVSSGTYSPVLGNDGCVNIICKDKYNSANNFIKTVTITYTIEKTEKTVTFDAKNSSFSGSAPYTIHQDSVDFSFNVPNWYNSGNGHFYIYTSNTTATIGWTPKTGYTIAVTGVSLNGQNTKEKHWEGWSKKEFTGSSYIRSHTSSDNTEVKISQSTSTATYSYTIANNTNVFPSGNALGNGACFKLRAEKGHNDADADNSYEYQINTATLTYKVTPPAPTLKSGDEVTANTVTLTDYFQPFNNAASMFYEVKKWNGSAYVAVESGFQINDNVFKATTVGVFQIVAKSDAIGAFTVSAASSPITITVEEVRPLTIAVGIQELYVDGTTTMVITDQFNTTEEVVFDYDDDFFDYDEESGVLTAKNAGNASFATTEKSIHVTQASDGVIDAVDMYIDFTIKKYTSTLTCSWGAEPWSKNVNFDSETAVTFSSNNDTGTPIVVTQSPASSVATYDGTNNKIVANFREGTATWTISQAEDYKYQAAVSKTLTVNVGTVSSECYVLDDSELVEWATVGRTEEYSVDGPASKLQFEARRVQLLGVSNNDHFFAEYSTETEGDSWTRLTPNIDLPQAGHEYWYPFEYDIPQGTKRVRMRSETGATGYRCIQNVKVTRKTYVDIENADEEAITEIDMPSKTASGDATTATFYVDYSTCDDVIKVVSDHPHITVSDASFSSTTAARKAITLTYNSSEAEEIEATVTIYTRYEHKTLTVNAETKGKLSTTIEYKGADSYAVDHANMSATDLFQVRDENGDLLASPAITLSSSATGVINTVSSNTAIDFLCGGAATITASYAGDATYAAASNLGRTITVNKLSDAISWSSVGDDGKIHVLADTDIPTSIASANSDIASYSVASANPYLSVTEEEGVYTLHAGIVGEVALTATSAGDCTYATASGSKTIAVDPREHAIIWDQNLEGIQTDDRGYITNRRITLNAYAVDNGSNPTSVPVSYEITGGGTFATIENGNELVINVANLSGTLSTTITATTTVGTKYAIVSETKTISVVRWGTNTAKSADNTSDIKDGKIVISAPHATFTFSGATAITEFGYATVMGKPEGYKLAQSLDNSGDSKTYNFSWVSTNANCSIQVNKISFWIKAYDSDAFVANKAKVSFDGAKEVSVGTAAMTANDGDFKTFSKAENYTNRNVPVVCWVTGSENFDFYIKNIAIEYTVYTTAPSATGDIEQVDRTINAESDKKTVDVRDLFSYATPAPSDFEYSYEIVGAPEHAFFLADGYTFWADAVGDYTVRAKVTMDEDHRESDWSDEKTIRVNRVPYVFNNSAADKNWETTTNWRIGGWPIENLPTADDDVIVRGQLSVSEEIPVRSLTIDGGLGGVVEIAPTGGLTVGAGGLVGSTSDKLILKASTAGKNGYLRVSPEYAGEMPNATIEYYCTGYYDQTKSGDNAATYQCVGAPITASGVRARDVYPAGTYLYTWNESTGAWTSGRAKLTFSPFQGFETSQRLSSDGWKAEYEGQLVSGRSTWTIDLAYTDGMGYNLLANSFAAPIAIENFEEDDFVNADQLIYILNAGTRGDSKANEGDYDAPGKWVGIPIKTASELAADGYPCMIPCMQGFWIKATGSSAQLKLDYSRLVWGVNYSGVRENKPLRAPKRASGNEDAPVTGRLKVNLFSETENDFVYLLESERYSANYENGYDARKMYSGDVNIFTITENEELSVDATNSIIGTRVGVHTGAETAYTLEFSHLSGENELALRDNETNEVIDINEGTQYTFFAEPNSVITERFQIVARQSAPSITTGVEKAENDTKVHKFIKDDQLYILKNGILYNALGAIVR